MSGREEVTTPKTAPYRGCSGPAVLDAFLLLVAFALFVAYCCTEVR